MDLIFYKLEKLKNMDVTSCKLEKLKNMDSMFVLDCKKNEIYVFRDFQFRKKLDS